MKNDNIALIVGGSSGIGLATAKQLLTEGYDVWLVGKNTKKLEQAHFFLENKKIGKIKTSCVNLYDKNEVNQFICEILESNAKISCLVNAAGYFKPISFLEHTTEDYDQQLALNKAFFLLHKVLLQL